MPSSGGLKLTTIDALAPGSTKSKTWNNANAEVYSLQAWPVVAAGVGASAEIINVRYVVHNNPQERELHYTVKNTGTTTADIAVWAFWWNA
jgi:hypothetical protein